MSQWSELEDIEGRTVERAFRYAEGVIELRFEDGGRMHIMLDAQAEGDPLVAHFLNRPTDTDE